MPFTKGEKITLLKLVCCERKCMSDLNVLPSYKAELTRIKKKLKKMLDED